MIPYLRAVESIDFLNYGSFACSCPGSRTHIQMAKETSDTDQVELDVISKPCKDRDSRRS